MGRRTGRVENFRGADPDGAPASDSLFQAGGSFSLARHLDKFSSSHTFACGTRTLSGHCFRVSLRGVDLVRLPRFQRRLTFYPFPPNAMEAAAVATKAKKPLKVFRLEDVSVSVFANERTIDGRSVTFYNVSMSKTYKKGDETRRTQTFGSNDIGKLQYVLKQADEFVQNTDGPRPARVEEV